MRSMFLTLGMLAVATASASPTLTVPLSGMGADGEKPVYWDFRLDTGRGSGAWKKIVVPSCWEQQGFGSYYYGTQGRGRPDDDPVIPKETGTYRRTFDVPGSWNDRAVHVVFEGAMTDTTVLINGQSAGPTHQGGFYRFEYDVTALVKPGRNEIEVRVSKESSNASVNHAERRGDYWTFGGIFRPVWLEARPRDHVAWTAIDARADGSFVARVHLGRKPSAGARLRIQLLDAAGKPFGAPLLAAAAQTDQVVVTGRLESPQTWTAETPHLYTARIALLAGDRELHRVEQRFGFRTLEVRPNDGVYLNGRKIVLKGINRHSFRPATGRTLTRAENYADARLIKDANMNAVRMSHYPPDAAFLEAADELGLYVLDELAGWQGYYDTPTGARLIGQIVRRDVNHPSILFWDNGNEGGWNRENDAEFHRWDLQRRPVLHPWATHSAINTDHYENYDSTVKLSAGPEIFMPTEFLHGLYDGGIGAGFRDYWDVMGRSPTVAGGFFWVFADEGVARTDRHGRIDNVGNAAPDGFVGPNHEKEGSYFAVKEIWSPVQVHDLGFASGKLRMRLENTYDFRDLESARFNWRVLRLPAAGTAGEARVRSSGSVRGPRLAPRASRDWEVPTAAEALGAREIIELEARDAEGRHLWTWVVAGAPAPATGALVGTTSIARLPDGKSGVRGGDFTLELDPATGGIDRLSIRGEAVPLRGPRLAAWIREEGKRTYREIGAGKLLALDLAPEGEPGVLARAHYDGPLREVTWARRNGELLMRYRLEYSGTADILGVRFDLAEDQLLGKRWAGAGPYRIWKNREAGTVFGLHETAYARSIPGETYHYPEFEGFFGPWHWLEMHTRAGTLIARNSGSVPYFGLYRPAPAAQPVLDLPDVGWSFLHAIPAIGTKFDLPDVHGPQSQAMRFDGALSGEVAFGFAPRN
jgi:hypothetical protein